VWCTVLGGRRYVNPGGDGGWTLRRWNPWRDWKKRWRRAAATACSTRLAAPPAAALEGDDQRLLGARQCCRAAVSGTPPIAADIILV
jgi:hypothetical protein